MSYVHAHVHTWYADTVYVRIGAIYIATYMYMLSQECMGKDKTSIPLVHSSCSTYQLHTNSLPISP